LAVLRKNVAALEAIKRRAEGQPVETPPLPTTASSTTSTTGATLTAAFEGWKRQRNRAPGTLAEYERAIKMFTELHGNLPLVQIKRSHARQFREALQDVPGRRNGKLLNASLPELAEWGHEHSDVPKITAGHREQATDRSPSHRELGTRQRHDPGRRSMGRPIPQNAFGRRRGGSRRCAV
jgi:hypothetical protein